MAGISPLDRTLSSIGYALRLPGAGISRPAGAKYSASASPSNVYSTISQYGGARGTAYSDVKGTSQPGSQTYTIPNSLINNMNNVSGQVQGAQIQNTGGGQPNPGQPNPSDGGGNNDALTQLLAELDTYGNEGYDVLNQQEARLRPENEADIANLTGRVDLNRTTATNEGNQLQSDITDQEKKQYGVIENAYQQAIRAKNALTQQIMARYGMGSSTGGAVSDLASQEFYRQQGGLNEQKVNVGEQVMKEIGKVKLFTKGKLDELDRYKDEAVTALKKDLGDRLNTIAVARAGIGENKSKMRLEAIQNTIASAREIANQSTTFRQTIASNAINQLQTTMGRTLTPNEIKAVMSDYGISGFGSIGSNTPTESTNPNYYGKTNQKNELEDLMG